MKKKKIEMEDEYHICPAYQEKRCSLLDYLEKEYRIKISRMSPNRIFMFLINPPSRNVKIQKLIAKHIFECFEKRNGEDGKKSHMKGMGILVVSLGSVNFGFRSHLGCSGQNAIIFRPEVPRLGLHAKKYKNVYLIYGDAFKNYLWVKVFDDNVLATIKSHCIFFSLCFNMVSFSGQKSLCDAQIGLL